jgi:hypothetical protein
MGANKLSEWVVCFCRYRLGAMLHRLFRFFDPMLADSDIHGTIKFSLGGLEHSATLLDQRLLKCAPT